jgi:hypothetical protein
VGWAQPASAKTMPMTASKANSVRVILFIFRSFSPSTLVVSTVRWASLSL